MFIVLKISLLATIFVGTGGTVFTEWGKKHRTLVFLAGAVAIVGASYLFRDIYRDFINQIRQDLRNNASTTQMSTFALPAQNGWVDSGIFVSPGDIISISASGQVYIGNVSAGQPNISNYQSPAGALNATAADQGKRFPFVAPELVPWSLVAKIGPSGRPFSVGTATTVTAPISGELYLSVNDNVFGDNKGSWSISVQLTPANPR